MGIMSTKMSCLNCDCSPQDQPIKQQSYQSQRKSKVIPRRRISRMDTPSSIWKRYFESLEVSGVERNSFS